MDRIVFLHTEHVIQISTLNQKVILFASINKCKDEPNIYHKIWINYHHFQLNLL